MNVGEFPSFHRPARNVPIRRPLKVVSRPDPFYYALLNPQEVLILGYKLRNHL